MTRHNQIILILVVFSIVSTIVFWAQGRTSASVRSGVGGASTSKQRVVHFPKDRSLGQLKVQDANTSRVIKSFHYWITKDGNEWELLGEAKGDIIVPAGERLALSVNQSGWKDLSPLSRLQPDDLYMLNISGPYLSGPRQDDRCMPHIAHLTSLKVLQLEDTAISVKGVKLLHNLKSLERLSLSKQLTDRGLAEIAQIHSLKGLYLRQSRITNAGLSHLANLTSLEELALGPGRMTNAGLAHLAKLPSLQYLMLSGKNFTDFGMVHLKNIPSLRILHARHLPHLTDAALVHIAQINTLENLSLHRVEAITDAGIAHLTKLHNLKKLDIWHSQVTDKGLAHLSKIESLEHLDLPSYRSTGSGLTFPITDRGLGYIAQLDKLKHLRFGLVGSGGPITNEGLKFISRLHFLEELAIGGKGITDSGMEHIAKLTNLRDLMLFGCPNVTNKGLVKLATLKSLQRLYVYKTNLTIGGLSCLNKLPNLRELNLHGVIQDYSALDISGLKSLEKLTIGTPHRGDVIRDEDLACLSKLTQLRWFQISSSVDKPMAISDRGMAYLADLTNMERLTVGGPNITDEGLKNLVNMKKLDMLNIYDGHLTDRGLQYLEQLDLLANLTLIGEHNFSHSSMRRLFYVLPNLTMVRTGSKWPGQMIMRQQVMARQRDYPTNNRQPSRPQRRRR